MNKIGQINNSKKTRDRPEKTRYGALDMNDKLLTARQIIAILEISDQLSKLEEATALGDVAGIRESSAQAIAAVIAVIEAGGWVVQYSEFSGRIMANPSPGVASTILGAQIRSKMHHPGVGEGDESCPALS